ncbi:DNA recombination/repair protein RecA [Lactococcus lactis]|uniref:Protein RecA n=1 Tax=Lactococcus lactis TaxID=1358 RepID=A0AAW7J254_9LACT|nr:DNA recombination/repair protein RecA [Lactococcus lactis]MDM7547434.1 DNA recombination/repair protein RecA [Lactococcus lactis]
MSEQLSKLLSKVNQTKTVIIFINQVRSTMSGLFLNKETTPGGSALKFYSSVRIEVKSGEKIKDGIDTIGKKQVFTLLKTRCQHLIKSQLLSMSLRMDSLKK